MRICLKCRHKKSFQEFTQTKNGREYFHSRCHECLVKTSLRCFKCEEIKPISSFHKNKDLKRGYQHKCKACRGFGHLENQGTTFFARNKEEIYAQRKARRESDPFFKLSSALRSRLWKALKSNKWFKNSNFSKYIGCNKETLISHIESQFKPGMNWQNHSHSGWHIDHIVPLSHATSAEELYKLSHYSNLQPLWASENMAKKKKDKRTKYR